MRAFRGRLLIRGLDRLSVGTDSAGPRQVLDELSGQQQLPIRAIEDVEEPVAVGLHDQLAALAFPAGVDHHRRLCRVPVPEIVRGELVVPLQLAAGRIEREEAVRIQVVADALIAVVVRSGIARRPEQRIGVRIVGAREPGIAAAMLDARALSTSPTPALPAWAGSRNARLLCRLPDRTPQQTPARRCLHRPCRKSQGCRRRAELTWRRDSGASPPSRHPIRADPSRDSTRSGVRCR